MKHTPGPWIVRFNSVETTLKLRITSDKSVLCEFPDPMFSRSVMTLQGKSDAESKANAQLMAAAPEMLEALMLAGNELTDRGGSKSLITAIDLIIAKAQGKS